MLLLSTETPSAADHVAANECLSCMDALTMRGRFMELRELEIYENRRNFHVCIVISGLSPDPREEEIMILTKGVREMCGVELPIIVLCVDTPEDALIEKLTHENVVLVSYDVNGFGVLHEAVKQAELATQNVTQK